MQDPLPYTWIAVGAGIFLWLVGQAGLKRQYERGLRPSAGGRLLRYLGYGALALGLYAGFRGPVRIGSIAFEPFPFAHFMRESHDKAYAYARGNITISSRSASGWIGTSKTTLECSVKNSGDQSLSCLFLRLPAAAGSSAPTVDLTLDGPFPAKQTATAILPIPSRVNRSCFDKPGIQNGHVVGARF